MRMYIIYILINLVSSHRFPPLSHTPSFSEKQYLEACKSRGFLNEHLLLT